MSTKGIKEWFGLWSLKWERYMRCDGSPDPSVQPDINTYISLWREDSENQIQKVLEECALTLEVSTLDLLFPSQLFTKIILV